MNPDERRRRRRRLRRQAAVLIFLMLAFGLAWFFESQATTTVVFVRSAEVLPEGGENPGLSAAGQARAEELARVVGDVDVDVTDTESLLRRILTDYKGKVVLVVTHTEPLPVLIRELHGSKKVPPMAATEHDNLYIVSIPWYGKVKTLRLKYGERYAAPSVPSAATPPAPAAQ